ncbi:MAG: Crp/Fnr family transcriptional regulator [Rhizobacter sp.]|nr:Crp/Fnr family transcriptional regulator [Rhizobacter sp.]
MDKDPNPRLNRLVGALPEAEWLRWRSQLEPIELLRGHTIHEPGRPLSHVYFPTTAIVSLQCVTDAGSSTEIAVVGSEGLVGLSIYMGGGSTSNRAVVQSDGQAHRMRAEVLMDEFNRPPVRDLLLRYTQALIAQMAQTAACNRHHTLDQQLCRLLLMRLDRLPGREIEMTHELIANMLGVRREGVTASAHSCQQAGLISYSRGHIAVLDRLGLERRACECYEVVRREYDRLLSSLSLG